MRLKLLPFTDFRRLLQVILVLLTVGSTGFAQITVTNATFPTAGTTLRTAFASNPSIGSAVMTPPGGNQVWDLSGLLQGSVNTTVFKAASEGSQAANVPGAELVSTSTASPGREIYYNVTSNKFEKQAVYDKFYDVVPLYLAQNLPPITERQAPLNFFDIWQSSSSILGGSNCITLGTDVDGTPLVECGFLPADFPPTLMAQLSTVTGGANIEKFRYRVTTQRTEAVNAYGTMIIPGGSFPVLRTKRTEYKEVRMDAKIPPLGWLDITDNAITAGFQGLGICTTYVYHFINDVEKEPIAIISTTPDCTCNGAEGCNESPISTVEYKLVAPLLSINNVTLSEGNSGTTNFNFTVSLSAPAPAGGVSFDIATQDGTTNPATQPSDYTAKSLTSQTIPAGSSTYNFTVAVNGDVDVEPDEIFFVNVSNVTGAVVDDGQGLGTITNDDVAPCNITVTFSGSPGTCNDNGTPNDPGDDFFTHNIQATFFNRPATGSLQIVPGGDEIGTYSIPVSSIIGNSHIFTGVKFKADGTPSVLQMNFTDEPTCIDEATGPAVQSCSAPPPPCNITVTFSGSPGTCNDNGTPNDPGDDFFTHNIQATFFNRPATGNLQIVPGGDEIGTYSIPVSSIIGNSHIFTGVKFKADGTPSVLQMNFTDEPTCIDEATGPAVQSCSAPPPPCNITVTFSGSPGTCNDNGTPNDPGDDFFTHNIQATFFNRPATGSLQIVPGGDEIGTYSIPVSSIIGNSHIFTGVKFKADGTPSVLQMNFTDELTCIDEATGPAVQSCSAPPLCSIISASFSNASSCNNNGTPADPSDDFYTADLTANFSTPPATGTLRIEPGNVNVLDVVEIAVGSLTGSSHTFTGVRLKTSGSAFAVEIEFSADNACVRTISAPAVASCAINCTPPTTNAPTVTQPTCATSTGTIVVNATGSGTLEYSINGGGSWTTTNTFSGLAPNSYNIAVRLQSNPSCVTNYIGNPVALTAAQGCVVVCPKGTGYWKNNPAAWPAAALPMRLGSTRTYTKQQLRSILSSAIKGDASLILAKQLIAAKLNIAAGATAPASVTSAITVADAAIGTSLIPMNVRPYTTLGKKMTSLAKTLESYNTGQLTAGCNVSTSTSKMADEISTDGFSKQVVLEQNYPNPAKSTTLIRYSIPVEANVDLTVFNNLGQMMAKLANGRMSAGMHQVNFDASKLAAGIYTYRLQTIDANGKVVVINKKMILSK